MTSSGLSLSAADDSNSTVPVVTTTTDGSVPTVDVADSAFDGAFDDLFDRERVPMVRLAYLLVGSEALAEEIVQDAFAVVYERWRRIDNPGAFLRRCVVNGAKGTLRRRAVERRRSSPDREPVVQPEGRELLDALAALPLQWRAVVVLRFYEQRTQEEIAEMLGMRLGTVKSSLHRGLARLREVIEP